MAWARLHDQANGNGKLLALSDSAHRLWSSGLIYCQANLTDGFIPDHVPATLGVRVSAAKLRGVITELCTSLIPGKAALWHRVPHGYQVHDYLDWNDAREDVLRDRRRSKDRVERFRQRLAETRGVNGEQNALVTPLQTANTTRMERRSFSGSTPTEDQDQEDQRRSRVAALSRQGHEPDDAPSVLNKLAHVVLDESAGGHVDPADVSEELKRQAARAGLRYDGDRVRKALDSAEAQRRPR